MLLTESPASTPRLSQKTLPSKRRVTAGSSPGTPSEQTKGLRVLRAQRGRICFGGLGMAADSRWGLAGSGRAGSPGRAHQVDTEQRLQRHRGWPGSLCQGGRWGWEGGVAGSLVCHVSSTGGLCSVVPRSPCLCHPHLLLLTHAVLCHPNSLKQGSPAPGPRTTRGPRPIRNWATQQEVSGERGKLHLCLEPLPCDHQSSASCHISIRLSQECGPYCELHVPPAPHPPHLSAENLSSTKPVPGAAKAGDRWAVSQNLSVLPFTVPSTWETFPLFASRRVCPQPPRRSSNAGASSQPCPMAMVCMSGPFLWSPILGSWGCCSPPTGRWSGGGTG